jgi:hypothetical protein
MKHLFAAAVVVAVGGASVMAQEQEIEYGKLGLNNVNGVISWQAHEGAASYRVYGNVSYWPAPSCAPDRPQPTIEHVDFNEDLPAGTTSYTLPVAVDPQLTFRKDLTFMIDVRSADGAVIARDATAFTADPFCTPEEIAAAGSGPGAAGGGTRSIALALASFGALAFAGGAMLRRGRAL